MRIFYDEECKVPVDKSVEISKWKGSTSGGRQFGATLSNVQGPWQVPLTAEKKEEL